MRRTETIARIATTDRPGPAVAAPRQDHLHDPLSAQGLHDSLGGSGAGPIQRQEEEEEMQMKADGSPIQRQEEEEEMQMKADGSPIQRQEEEEEMQMKAAAGGAAAGQVSYSNHGGEPLADGLRGRMESSFGADFSGVRIHRDGAAADLGAKAFTQGDHIHVKPGQYDTRSTAGQSLLGHELAHVQQQRAGRVAVQGKGLPINADPALEAEADRAGARAAAGKRAH